MCNFRKKLIGLVTVRKRSLRRLCFYTCLSVLRGGVRSPGPYPGGGWEVWLGASRPIPWGRLGGLAGGGVSRPIPRGYGPGIMDYYNPMGIIPACTEAKSPPSADGYCCGQYASYWNAFLLLDKVMMSCNQWHIGVQEHVLMLKVSWNWITMY